MKSLRTAIPVALLFLLMTSCRGKEGTTTEPFAVPASISKVAGDAQTGTVATTLPTALVVKVRDASGNPISNARVQWEASSGSGQPQPEVSFTNSNGEATTQWVLGQVAGTAQLTAQVGGLNPIVFSATALPGAVARVVSLPDEASVGVGDTVRIRSAVRDQFGNDVPGQALTYSTPDAAIVTVNTSGLVTALGVGSGRVIATAGTRADTVVIVVQQVASVCGTTPPRLLAAGEVFIPTSGTSSTRVCLSAPADAAADFGMVLTWTAAAFSNTLVADLYGMGVDGPTSPNLLMDRAAAMQVTVPLAMDAEPIHDRAAELRIRDMERRELAGLRDIAREQYRERDGIAALVQPKIAKVGDLLRLNANAFAACESPDMRVGRVAAVGTRSIIVVDTTNPSGGYTDAEFASVAAMFDTLIYPMNTEAFGNPSDVSGYGKIILFYSRAVNALTPPSSGFVIGGFFFARDLYPKTARNGLPACPASNEAEVMYLLVPDPNATINGNRRTKDEVTRLNIGTIAHELQHLINSSRRLYVNNGAVASEETWLDEGLSHVAEELLYLRLAGYTDRQNLTIQDVAGTQARSTVFTNYGIQNFGRLYEYLRNPETNSPYAVNDSLSTRGAVWSFLRYAAAREGPGNEEAFFRRLVNSTTAGIANLQGAVPNNQFADYLRDWSISNLADDYSPEVMANLQPQYRNPAWSFRSIYPALRIGGQTLNVYPLATRSLFNNIPQRIALPGGATSYIRFSVPAGKQGVVSLSSNGAALPAAARTGVVRLR